MRDGNRDIVTDRLRAVRQNPAGLFSVVLGDGRRDCSLFAKLSQAVLRAARRLDEHDASTRTPLMPKPIPRVIRLKATLINVNKSSGIARPVIKFITAIVPTGPWFSMADLKVNFQMP
jgi:hypothetical protein